MSTVWQDTFFGCRGTKQLKQLAYKYKDELDALIEQNSIFNIFKIVGVKAKLKKVLDEIDYQEGRLQYANRAHSKPNMRLTVCEGNDECECSKCWVDKRKNYFKI